MRSGRKSWRRSTVRSPGSKGERQRLEKIERVPELLKAFWRIELGEWRSGLPFILRTSNQSALPNVGCGSIATEAGEAACPRPAEPHARGRRSRTPMHVRFAPKDGVIGLPACR